MPPVGASTAVLVTGATGFIGRQVTRHLLACGRPVIAMARSREDLSAEARVLRAVGHLPDGCQLEIIEADLRNLQQGLTPGALRRLRDTVETVIHCAGDTAFFPADMGRFRAGHIDGPLALLTALHGGRLRRWGHLSTAYVCGKRSGTVFEDEGDVGQDFHNPYERVKLDAEMSMLAASDRLGIDLRVFRPSVVVGPAPETAGGQPSNLFFTFIRMMEALARLSHRFNVRIRIEAAPKARFNIVPVEYVAQALVALAEHPDGTGKTFHLVVSDAPVQEAMLAMIADYFGLPGLSIVDACCAPLARPSALERKVARLQAPYREYFTQDLHFDDRVARALLDRVGLPRPTLSSEEVHRIIGQALLCPSPSAQFTDEGT
jgi:nucleoside-diphosphate-sugar epimerase